jgi:hypothetical protein
MPLHIFVICAEHQLPLYRALQDSPCALAVWNHHLLTTYSPSDALRQVTESRDWGLSQPATMTILSIVSFWNIVMIL